MTTDLPTDEHGRIEVMYSHKDGIVHVSPSRRTDTALFIAVAYQGAHLDLDAQRRLREVLDANLRQHETT